jgi:hypothetical protein
MCAEKPTQVLKNSYSATTRGAAAPCQGIDYAAGGRRALGITTRTIAYHKYHIMGQFHLATMLETKLLFAASLPLYETSGLIRPRRVTEVNEIGPVGCAWSPVLRDFSLGLSASF